MADPAPPKRNGLKNFLLNFLINFALVWLIFALAHLLIGFLYRMVFWPVISLGLEWHNHETLGVALVISLIFILALILTLITLKKFIPAKIAARFEELNFINSLRMINRIREGGMAFPEVTFQDNETGNYISGVLMSRETEEPVPDSNEPIPLNNVWELRPNSISGKMNRLKDGAFRLTGRPGWRAIRRVWSWGLLGD